MSQVTQPRVRRVWVVLGASVLSSLLLATPALAGDVQLSGLQSAPTHQRFIVKSRDGRAPVAATARLASSLNSGPARIACGVFCL
ncbi:peptidase S8, partial [Pseudoxanthomonas sp. KAs_5_3]